MRKDILCGVGLALYPDCQVVTRIYTNVKTQNCDQ